MYEQLKLENQLCFPIYAVSRMITKHYTPLLKELDVTYPQYLVLLVLWEKDGLKVVDIAEKLLLETNTVTPLLKRMEEQKILYKNKSETDERVYNVFLTEYGKNLMEKAKDIPLRLSESSGLDLETIIRLRKEMYDLLSRQ